MAKAEQSKTTCLAAEAKGQETYHRILSLKPALRGYYEKQERGDLCKKRLVFMKKCISRQRSIEWFFQSKITLDTHLLQT